MRDPPPRILVVDDVASIAEELKLLLTLEGLPTVTASSVCDTLRALHAHPSITVIVADVRLKAESGYDIPRAIRIDPDLACKTYEIMFMTGEASLTETPLQGSVLLKPFDLDQFIITLRTFLDKDCAA